MNNKTNPIVTYRQINEAFNKHHESVMESANSEALKLTQDPVESAMMLVALGNALKVLEQTDGGTDAGVLLATNDRGASLLQSFLAQQSAEEGKLKQLPAGGEEAKFDEHDLGRWFLSLFSWWKGFKPHPWQQAPPLPEPFPATAGTTRLALLGDWGTGLYGAPICGSTIESDRQGYQMLFHLGDVYYSGDEKEVQDRFLHYWPTNARAISRALNSNHEMYTGGKAYFSQTLKQFGQAASYFAFQNDHWLLVGLDTAYNDPDWRYDKARLTSDQISWLKELVKNKDNRKLVLFTHHQPISWYDRQEGEMNTQLSWLLAEQKIFAWYWGHEHRMILYNKHPAWGFHGRCVGHSGYPYFRDKVQANPVEIQKDTMTLRRMPAGSFAPAGLILDGPNQYLPGEEEKFGANGFMTLEFQGEHLNEIIHSPDGTRVYERELVGE